ncbi:hypothetical protein GCM10022284_10340 [Streptomyces hundungensis]
MPRLAADGHGVHPLTLSGLAEKRGVPAGQQTHVQEIVDEVERSSPEAGSVALTPGVVALVNLVAT